MLMCVLSRVLGSTVGRVTHKFDYSKAALWCTYSIYWATPLLLAWKVIEFRMRLRVVLHFWRSRKYGVGLSDPIVNYGRIEHVQQCCFIHNHFEIIGFWSHHFFNMESTDRVRPYHVQLCQQRWGRACTFHCRKGDKMPAISFNSVNSFQDLGVLCMTVMLFVGGFLWCT